jgi:hypothetical protein
MRASTIASILALGSSQASAQYYINQTGPFDLIVLSSNSTINGTTLGACHEGAAIEGLCLDGVFDPSVPPLPYTTYNFNYSTQFTTPDPVLGYSGLLTFTLLVRTSYGIQNFSFPMGLQLVPTSDVAAAMFGFAAEQIVSFDKSDLLTIVSNLDDTVSPPTHKTQPLYRWFICWTNQIGYYNQQLNWVVGVHTHPQNPTCQRVDVKRVFV